MNEGESEGRFVQVFELSGIILTPSFFVPAKVWEAVQNDVDPIQVEVATVKGRRLPRFSSQLVVRKPLVPGSAHIPVFSAKRNSSSETSTPASKRAKVEVIEKINTPFVPLPLVPLN
ncbi:hypothetical protein LIER_43526 [Lithospermum erythrorhizon]|uniref:Uncharacterized protein n=1 Tax=Lithospermum erythrorhizon TaxID=34254 RepID=A0AAV3Q906_LITER